MAYSLLLSTFLSLLINAWPNKKLLNYSLQEQMKDIYPSILIAMIMGVAISGMSVFRLGTAVTLLLQVVIGAIIYLTLSSMLKLEEFQYLVDFIRTRKNDCH